MSDHWWVWIVIVLSALCGMFVMLLTIAIGAGDTSVGNSPGPWITGEAILVGIPLAVGAACYAAMRWSGASRMQAVVTAAIAAPAMFVLPVVIFWLIVWFS
jgi:hypothetical protein